MKKFLTSLAIVASMLLSQVPIHADAANRVLVYLGQNPDNNLQSLNSRYQRLQDGIMLRDLLGPLGTSGAWSSLQITAATGLFVTVNNATSNQLGAIYQFAQDDPHTMPNCCSSETLPADSTLGVAIAYQPSNAGNPVGLTNNTNPNPSGQLGALATPGAGLFENTLIEAQISTTTDTGNSTYPFIDNSGNVTNNSVPTQRSDVLVYQLKGPGSTSGVDCAHAQVPTVDSGWISIGWVCTHHGESQVLSGDITMDNSTNFVGGTFGKVTFGGSFAAQGNATPSTMTTTQNNGCGLSDGLGMEINNAIAGNPSGPYINNGNHEMVVDQLGDIAVCGPQLYIFAQNGDNNEVANITFDTTVDNSTAHNSSLFFATNSDQVTTNGSCANLSYCNILSGEKDECNNAGNPTTAVTTLHANATGKVIIQPAVPTSGTGVQLLFLNVSGGNISDGTSLNFDYACL